MLEDKWRALWERSGGSGTVKHAFDRLCDRYGEPQRHYHTLAHVQHCLETFDGLRGEADDPNAVEMALWFHDAVYDPRRKDNEKQSAELAAVVLDVGGFPSTFIETVCDLVRATAPGSPTSGSDVAVLLDCDLAILGASPAAFDEYERQIRREFAWMPPLAFLAGRSALIHRLLARPSIYVTQAMRLGCEPHARANLTRSLERLKRELDSA